MWRECVSGGDVSRVSHVENIPENSIKTDWTGGSQKKEASTVDLDHGLSRSTESISLQAILCTVLRIFLKLEFYDVQCERGERQAHGRPAVVLSLTHFSVGGKHPSIVVQSRPTESSFMAEGCITIPPSLRFCHAPR